VSFLWSSPSSESRRISSGAKPARCRVGGLEGGGMCATGEINQLLRNAAERTAELSGRVKTGESRGPFARFRSTNSMQRQVSKAFDRHGPHALTERSHHFRKISLLDRDGAKSRPS
jgi:hypothetical protein